MLAIPLLVDVHDVQKALVAKQLLKVEVRRLVLVQCRADHSLDELAEIRLLGHVEGELARDGERARLLAFIERLLLVAQLEREPDLIGHVCLALPRRLDRADVDDLVKAGYVISCRYRIECFSFWCCKCCHIVMIDLCFRKLCVLS
jgi:hypothetical protein